MTRPALTAAAVILTFAAPVALLNAPGTTSSAAPASHSRTVEFSEVVRVDRRTQIGATATKRVYVGGSIVVTGVVKVRAGTRAKARPVKLLERSGTRWRTVARKSSTRRGSFRFVTPAKARVRTRVFLVDAPRSDGLPVVRTGRLRVSVVKKPVAPVATTPPPVVTPAPEVSEVPQVPATPAATPAPTETAPAQPTPTETNPADLNPSEPHPTETAPADPTPDEPTVPAPTATATVEPTTPVTTAPAPPSAPVGAATDWTYLFSGGVRWNPCTSIRWAYNPDGGYAGALDDVKSAYARIAERTGLRFAYVGTTTHVEKTGTTFPTYADMAIGWATESRVPQLAGSTVGVGGGSAQGVTGKNVAYKMTRGYVVLDKAHHLRPGYSATGDTTWGQVMTHEVLHALGLGHATTAQQVMYGAANATNHLFGAGDVTGMTKIGATRGCL